jgi:hypothetical protein
MTNTCVTKLLSHVIVFCCISVLNLALIAFLDSYINPEAKRAVKRVKS